MRGYNYHHRVLGGVLLTFMTLYAHENLFLLGLLLWTLRVSGISLSTSNEIIAERAELTIDNLCWKINALLLNNYTSDRLLTARISDLFEFDDICGGTRNHSLYGSRVALQASLDFDLFLLDNTSRLLSVKCVGVGSGDYFKDLPLLNLKLLDFLSFLRWIEFILRPDARNDMLLW
jgi:hypothetical protein